MVFCSQLSQNNTCTRNGNCTHTGTSRKWLRDIRKFMGSPAPLCSAPLLPLIFYKTRAVKKGFVIWPCLLDWNSFPAAPSQGRRERRGRGRGERERGRESGKRILPRCSEDCNDYIPGTRTRARRHSGRARAGSRGRRPFLMLLVAEHGNNTSDPEMPSIQRKLLIKGIYISK